MSVFVPSTYVLNKKSTKKSTGKSTEIKVPGLPAGTFEKKGEQVTVTRVGTGMVILAMGGAKRVGGLTD